MGTVILKWNPNFSSYTMLRYLQDLEKCALANNGNVGMNWSIWEYDKVKDGDTCYLLKVGYGQTGIVAKGRITSKPYSGEDWSWNDRPTMYCDFNFEVMINPDAYPILTSSDLSKIIPDFDWKGGHSGMVLTESQAESLEHHWEEYLKREEQYFEKASDQNLFLQYLPTTPDNIPYTLRLKSEYRGQVIHLRHQSNGLITSISIYNYYRVLGKLGVKSWKALQQFFHKNFPSLNDLSNLCATLLRCQIDYQVEFFKDSEEEDDSEDF